MSEEKESTSALARYWKIYGGAGAVFKSRYFWCAFLMTVILYPSWSHQGWWNDILSLMPNLLGFSLGGFAMWIAIGDEAFKKIKAHSYELLFFFSFYYKLFHPTIPSCLFFALNR
ncbi:Uncharacterised protein [Salmonella enterica subsp. enterica serovar Bovismorbificans]|nr:Uncharacterised protein [Salmonella enterica subsp. enterica serovar Bovismorbificans]